MEDDCNSGGSSADDEYSIVYNIDDEETIIQAVLNAVSAVTNLQSSPTEKPVSVDGGQMALPPLFNVVDPDALAQLSRNPADSEWKVSFPYAECEVTVTSDGTVQVIAPAPAQNQSS